MKEHVMEEFIFDMIDQFKFLFFPEKWNSTFMDYSKNDLFGLFFVYRRGQANMSEISEYLGVPLNTTTGVISRLEKKGIVKRERDLIDKRVVTICISEEGSIFISQLIKETEHYYHLIMDSLSEDEKRLLMKISVKLLDVFNRDSKKNGENDHKKKVRKIIIE